MNKPLTVAEAVDLGGVEADVGKLRAVENLRAKHRLLNLGAIVVGDIAINDFHPACVNAESSGRSLLVNGAVHDGCADVVLLTECGEGRGLVEVHAQLRVISVDRRTGVMAWQPQHASCDDAQPRE